MTSHLQVEVLRTEDDVTIVCGGEVDGSTASQLTRAVGEGMARDVRSLHLDLSGVSFMDSTGLRTVVVAATQSEALGIAFSVTPSQWVERLLEVVGMVDLVHGRPPQRREAG
jgi:anti-anti-sigma factor